MAVQNNAGRHCQGHGCERSDRFHRRNWTDGSDRRDGCHGADRIRGWDRYHWRNWIPPCYYFTHALAPLMAITDTAPVQVNSLMIARDEQDDQMRLLLRRARPNQIADDDHSCRNVDAGLQKSLRTERRNRRDQLKPRYFATNPPKGDGHRNGAVRDRSQVKNTQSGNWTKRDTNTGRFMDQKQDGKPFKGVRKEK